LWEDSVDEIVVLGQRIKEWWYMNVKKMILIVMPRVWYIFQ
jgi:hypothetical protein